MLPCGIPLVCTNDVHYLRRDDFRPHDILLCISTGKTMSDPSRLRYKDAEFFLKSRDDMLRAFGEMEAALDRTWEIAQRCEVSLEKIKDPFPKFEVPDGHSADSYFEYVARMGFEKRRARLEALRAKGLLKHDLAAVKTLFTAFNRWLDEDWGVAYENRIFGAPYISLVDLPWACAELEWAISRGARIVGRVADAVSSGRLKKPASCAITLTIPKSSPLCSSTTSKRCGNGCCRHHK